MRKVKNPKVYHKIKEQRIGNGLMKWTLFMLLNGRESYLTL